MRGHTPQGITPHEGHTHTTPSLTRGNAVHAIPRTRGNTHTRHDFITGSTLRAATFTRGNSCTISHLTAGNASSGVTHHTQYRYSRDITHKRSPSHATTRPKRYRTTRARAAHDRKLHRRSHSQGPRLTRDTVHKSHHSQKILLARGDASYETRLHTLPRVTRDAASPGMPLARDST